MAEIPWPLSSAPGRSPQESSGRLINCYAVPLGKEARHQASIHRVPGLASFGTSGGTGFRGMLLVGSTLYAAWGSRVERYTSSGGAGTLVGTLNGTAKSYWARNNNATPQIVVVSPGDGAFVVTAGAVNSYPDADLPAPNSVCFHGGYFFFTIGDARCFASGINATTVDPLHFITAESKSDSLTRAIPFGGQILLCGPNSMEVWGPPINATGFPYSYVHTIPRGLVAPSAIAGHEDGFGKGPIFVGDDNAVHMINGYIPEKISPPDLDRLIEQLSDKSTLEACAYVSEGRSVWTLSCASWTWEFNLNSLKWNERESYGLTRWRGTQSHYAFGKWLVGDTASGAILQLSSTTKKELTDPLRARIESGPVHKFPHLANIARIDLDITAGVGVAAGSDPIETDPAVEISVARDCVNFDNPRFVKLGRQSKYGQKVFATRFGRSGPLGFRVRADISDPVDFGLLGGSASAEVTASPSLK